MFNCLAVKNIKIAKEWHPTKNGSITPKDIHYGSGKKAWWKCLKGDDHEWEAVIASRTKNDNGCPFCSGRYADKNNNLFKSNPNLIKDWHLAKNGNLSPRQFTPRSGKVVWWKCDKGDDHEWKSSIVNRVKGNGCPVCSGRKVVHSNCLATLKPGLSKEWHKSKNGKLSPNDVTLGSNKKVWWKCDKGPDHEWIATVVDRVQGGSCPVCVNRKIVNSNCLQTLNPELIKEWHPAKNTRFTPKTVHPGSSFKVWWRCRHGHEWNTAVYRRAINGQGCPRCNKTTTLPELRIYSELKTIFPTTQHRVVVKGKEIDIYIPEISLGIEYDGVYWHKNKYEQDKLKNESLASDLTLIRIREKGLSRISKNDILLDRTSISLDAIKLLLKSILKIVRLSPVSKEKINHYLTLKTWIASKNFEKLSIEKNHIDFESSISYLFPEIVKEWHPTLNELNLPEYFTPGSHKKVWWKCPKGDDHEWKSAIYSRIKGHKCPICCGLKIVDSNNLEKLHPNISNQWHPIYNNELRPSDVSPGSHKKVWWKCNKASDHEWEASIRSRVNGIGCPFCSNKKISKDNVLSVTHPEIAKEWHPTKNKGKSPDKLTYGIGIKVWWKCRRNHEWEAIISNRTRRGDGCPFCRKNKYNESQLELPIESKAKK